MSSTLKFLLAYRRPERAAVEVLDTSFERDGDTVGATIIRPAGAAAGYPLPGWVVLHGLTIAGREHASLIRFARAFGATGTVVMIPDIPEWRRLRVRSDVAVPTIRSAVLALDERPDVLRGRIGLLGFSFGATQGLVAAADPRLRGHLAAVAAWGGYRDVPRLFRFGLTGEHDLDGRSYRADPDPYGRWIMGANYLTDVPGHGGRSRVAGALDRLATEAGRIGVDAGDPRYDPLKRELRSDLAPDDQEVFDLFAPDAGRPPADLPRAKELAAALAAAAVRVEPLLDPSEALARFPVPVLVAHGRDDRLVPFTESLRLFRDLPVEARQGCTVTGLFAHSGGTDAALGPLGLVREGARFAGVLRRIVRLV